MKALARNGFWFETLPGKNLFPSSRDCWQHSFPFMLSDCGPQVLAGLQLEAGGFKPVYH